MAVVSIFRAAAERHAAVTNMKNDWSIYHICQTADLDLSPFPKEGCVIQAVWIAFLSVMKMRTAVSALKYPTVEMFQTAYGGCFDHYSAKEISNLWETANWMSELFKFIPAKKNKGLALAIVPKLIEGWFMKYVTGSGQTKSTADRVKIFETEGNVTASQRGRNRLRVFPKHSAHQHHQHQQQQQQQQQCDAFSAAASVSSIFNFQSTFPSPAFPVYTAPSTSTPFVAPVQLSAAALEGKRRKRGTSGTMSLPTLRRAYSNGKGVAVDAPVDSSVSVASSYTSTSSFSTYGGSPTAVAGVTMSADCVAESSAASCSSDSDGEYTDMDLSLPFDCESFLLGDDACNTVALERGLSHLLMDPSEAMPGDRDFLDMLTLLRQSSTGSRASTLTLSRLASNCSFSFTSPRTSPSSLFAVQQQAMKVPVTFRVLPSDVSLYDAADVSAFAVEPSFVIPTKSWSESSGFEFDYEI